MRLESALYASREGLTSHGQAIAVIGDNISNVETVGFKASRAEFSDIYAESVGSKDSGPLTGGNGAQISRVRQLHSSSEATFTGRALDIAIGGDGFFVVGEGDNLFYTRAGNFRLDTDGNLVSADGQPVLGSTTTTTGTGGDAGGGGTGTGTITLSKINLLNLTTTATATSAASMSGNLSSSAAVTTPPAAPATFNELSSSASAVQNLEVYDSLGTKRGLVVAFFKTAANTWTAQAYVDGSEVGDTAGKPVKVGEVTGIAFQGDGSIAEANKAAAKMTLTPAWGNGANAGNIALDLSGYTQNANPSELKSKTQDGKGSGSISSYEVKSNGDLYASLSNGQVLKLATIAIAKFENVDGLERAGSTYYKATTEAGDRTLLIPGEKGAGQLQGGALERSNSDLSTQFTDLVLYQRGYQANSQIMNAVGQALRETLGLVR